MAATGASGASGGFVDRYGPWAVVTGAAQGIGAEFARQVHERGVGVVLVDRDAPALAAQAASLDASAAGCRQVVADLSDRDAVDAVLEAVADLEIGLVVCNAAVPFVGRFVDQGLEASFAQLDVNCRVPLALIHHLLPDLLVRDRGGIITVSSMSALRGAAFTAGYAASKAWNLVLAESLGDELRDTGVDVMAVLPGTTRTPGWLASDPRDSVSTSGAMEAEDVVRESLEALGSHAVVIPGQANRDAEAFLSGLDREKAVRLTGDVMRQTYPDAAGANTPG